MTITNTEITAESLVQRVQRLLYPAQSTDDMILEHALADPDGVIVKNLKAKPAEHRYIDYVCDLFESELVVAWQRVDSGEIEGCFDNRRYYPDPRYAGKSIEETVEGLQPRYEARMRSANKIEKVLEYTAKVLNPVGIYLGVSENPHPSLALLGLILYSSGTLATTAVVTALTSWPVGLAHLVAAVGSTEAWLRYRFKWNTHGYILNQKPKDVETYEQVLSIANMNEDLKNAIKENLLSR